MELRSLRTWAPLATILLLCWPLAGRAQDNESIPDPGALAHRVWLEGGIGVGQLAFESTPYADAGTGLSIEALVGARITPRWSLGFAIGAVGLKPSNDNYDPYDHGTSVWGEAVTHVRLVTRFEPRRDHGWFYDAGLGLAYYHNKRLEDLAWRTGGRIGQGSELMLRAGYDWLKGSRGHIQVSLGVDTGHVSMEQPYTGSFQYTAVSANLSVALR